MTRPRVGYKEASEGPFKTAGFGVGAFATEQVLGTGAPLRVPCPSETA